MITAPRTTTEVDKGIAFTTVLHDDLSTFVPQGWYAGGEVFFTDHPMLLAIKRALAERDERVSRAAGKV